jgi:hypothetical protein
MMARYLYTFFFGGLLDFSVFLGGASIRYWGLLFAVVSFLNLSGYARKIQGIKDVQ